MVCFTPIGGSLIFMSAEKQISFPQVKPKAKNKHHLIFKQNKAKSEQLQTPNSHVFPYFAQKWMPLFLPSDHAVFFCHEELWKQEVVRAAGAAHQKAGGGLTSCTRLHINWKGMKCQACLRGSETVKRRTPFKASLPPHASRAHQPPTTVTKLFPCCHWGITHLFLGLRFQRLQWCLANNLAPRMQIFFWNVLLIGK